MTLPYENATSGERALGEIQKLLRGFGCNKFGSMIDSGTQRRLAPASGRKRPRMRAGFTIASWPLLPA